MVGYTIHEVATLNRETPFLLALIRRRCDDIEQGTNRETFENALCALEIRVAKLREHFDAAAPHLL